MWNKKKKTKLKVITRTEASYPLAEWPLNHRYKSRVILNIHSRASFSFFSFSFFFLFRYAKRRLEDLLHRRIEKNASRASLTGKRQKLLKCRFHIVILDERSCRQIADSYTTYVTFDTVICMRRNAKTYLRVINHVSWDMKRKSIFFQCLVFPVKLEQELQWQSKTNKMIR